MEQIKLKEDSEMEFYVILVIFALGLLVVGAAFVNGAKFVLGMIGRIVDCIFGRHGDWTKGKTYGNMGFCLFSFLREKYTCLYGEIQ